MPPPLSRTSLLQEICPPRGVRWKREVGPEEQLRLFDIVKVELAEQWEQQRRLIGMPLPNRVKLSLFRDVCLSGSVDGAVLLGGRPPPRPAGRLLRGHVPVFPPAFPLQIVISRVPVVFLR